MIDVLSEWRRTAPVGLSLAEARRRAGALAAAPVAGAAVPVNMARIIKPEAAARWMLTSLSNITPQRVSYILDGALAGDHASQYDLFALMEDTWPRLAKDLNEVKRAVQQLEWKVEPWAEEEQAPTPQAVDRMSLVSNAIWRMRPRPGTDEVGFLGLVYDLLDAWGKGTSVVELLWENRIVGKRGEMWVPRAAAWVHPQHYLWADDGSIQLRLETGQESLPENAFIVGVARARTGHPLGAALLRPLAWWWCAANFSAEWLLNLAQVFGLPIRWATYEPGASDALVTQICAMLENMGSAGWAAFPAGTDLKTIESSKGTTSFPQVELLDRADRQCDLLILGQTLTTDVGSSGSRALGDVHLTVRDEIVRAAAEWVADVLNQQMVPSIIELNYGDMEMPPELCPEPTKEDDLKARADRDEVLARIGLKFPKAWMYKSYGIPLPQDGEEVIGAAPRANQPPGGGATAADPPIAGELSARRQNQAPPATEALRELIPAAVARVTQARVRWLEPLREEMDRLIVAAQSGKIGDEDLQRFLADAAKSMPDLFAKLDHGALAEALEDVMGGAAAMAIR